MASKAKCINTIPSKTTLSIKSSSKTSFASKGNTKTWSKISFKSDSSDVSDITNFINKYKERIQCQLQLDEGKVPSQFVSFAEKGVREPEQPWLEDNEERFFKNTPNRIIAKLDYLSELGYITALSYSPDGDYIIVGHATGLVQVRNGFTGEIQLTLRNIQFPPKPIYSIVHSKQSPRNAYAACTDGIIYHLSVPEFIKPELVPKMCIQKDPALSHLTTHFFSSGESATATPYNHQICPALCLDISADGEKIIVGYADTSVRVYDMNTAETIHTYKMHKIRLQNMPKHLRRVHSNEVVALAAHEDDPNMFGTAAWDETLRIWDPRCSVGCMMTFEGLNVVSNSIDFCRGYCIAGSWKPTEALSVWDLTAQKRQCIVRVQNRRPDVDGEYIYACKYWKSNLFNRKGKYGIIGGSGTNCVEVINLHNRYITCSYPHKGNVLALTSHGERIAFGGTATTFHLVEFHDPKHEVYDPDKHKPFGYNKGDVDFGFLYDTTWGSISEMAEMTVDEEQEEKGDLKSTADQKSLESTGDQKSLKDTADQKSLETTGDQKSLKDTADAKSLKGDQKSLKSTGDK